MKARQPNNNVEQLTYGLLVRPEDKKRALLETIIYGLLILSALAAILQFADQPVLFGGLDRIPARESTWHVTTELKNADQLGNTELISVILEGSLPVFFQPPSLTAAPA